MTGHERSEMYLASSSPGHSHWPRNAGEHLEIVVIKT